MSNLPDGVLDTYLQRVAGYLKDVPPAIREGELQELSGHLIQLTDDLRAQGHSAELAASLAIGRFGRARKVGLKLRDVWEGNQGAVLTLFATLSSNWLLQILSLIGFIYTLYRAMLSHQELAAPLYPFFVALLWTLILLVPFAWNWKLGQWGGRRVIFATFLAYAPIILAAPFSPWVSSVSLGEMYINFSAPTIPLLTVVVAILGAWSGSISRREHRWAAVGSAPFSQASVLVKRRRPFQPATLLLWMAGLAITGTGSYAEIRQRVRDTLHPPTPEAAVRVLLQAPGYNPGEMEPSTNITTRLLPAIAPQESAGTERRVAYTATMHASGWYRQRRIAYNQQQIQEASKGQETLSPVVNLRANIARLQREGYTLSRTAIVRHTAQGWDVDTSGDAVNQPWAWLYDMGYEPISPQAG